MFLQLIRKKDYFIDDEEGALYKGAVVLESQGAGWRIRG